MRDILGFLQADGSFSTLVALLEKGGLNEMLRGDGPFTVFAPTDVAFGRINLDELAGDHGDLVATLGYHIVTGKYTSEDVLKDERLMTSSGKSLTVRTEEGRPVIDNAKYERADIECANGIIHAIDNVFLPRMSGWYCGCC